MDTAWKTILWNQFGAAIDMLENAINACPDTVWGDPAEKPHWNERDLVGFWYIVYHTLFYTDLYLSESEKGFAPPPPYDLGEMDPAGVLPDRMYTKAEMLTYLKHDREKCRARIAALTDDDLHKSCGFERRDFPVVELMLYNMRHVQHHAAQLNLLLRQRTASAPLWVSKTKHPL